MVNYFLVVFDLSPSQAGQMFSPSLISCSLTITSSVKTNQITNYYELEK